MNQKNLSISLTFLVASSLSTGTVVYFMSESWVATLFGACAVLLNGVHKVFLKAAWLLIYNPIPSPT